MREKVSEHFYRDEFACNCGCGFDVVDIELNRALEDVRFHFNSPIDPTGPNRCAKKNAETKGAASNSQHVLGKALDFRVRYVPPDKVADYLEAKYPNKFGIGRYDDRTHLDVRPTPARWDKRTKGD